MKRLSQEQWSNLLLALDTQSVKTLSKKYNVSESTIYKKMKINNLPTHSLSESQWNEILSKVDKVSPAELARHYDITPAGIHYQIKKQNIDYKPFVTRKHYFNEDFFEFIDNEHKAYWLGFIMADGCIENPSNHGNPKRLKIQLSAIDKELLQLFLNDIESTTIKVEEFLPHKSTYGINLICRIQVNSVKMCDDLSKYGIVPNKTGKEIVPEIPDNMMRHFIRGFFDGDGTVYKQKDKPVISFTGNQDMLYDLSYILIKNLNVSNVVSPSKYKSKNVSQLGYSRKQDTFSFYHYIYDNSSIYLERKYAKYTLLISQ